jgi:uncharacterized repeat protein (TIGR01451 family)
LTNQPALVPRTLVTLAALDANASPNGWIDDLVNETRGNNVDAHTDRNNDNIADLPRPAGSPFRVFDFSMDLATQDPTAYSNASVVQLFYLCNWYHDRLYQLGFTEAAGNFQNTNFGRGGLGNDAVQADALDGGGTDNANFSTPPDGSPGRMQMYIFSGPTPRRDGDLDAEIVFHEHTHGLSNRRVGGGVGLSALQSEGMGEGWSDWYGLTLLSESGDNLSGNYAAGGYATYKFLSPTFLQNYYFGIRRYPYSTDMTKNPLTFKDIDPAQIDAHSGIPKSPVIGGGGADEVHNQGEVWCVTLWEARANLITKYGFATGNQLILQLVTDGMNLSPVNPNFLQARDAIIQADLVDTGGANRNELWAAFAKRGMGATATSPSSSTTAGVHESFDPPDDLSITPNSGFTASGPVGGPFTPNSLALNLTNSGATAFNWSLANTSTWLNVSLASGTLAPGGPAAVVTVTVNASAASLPMGVYAGTVRITNVTSGIGQGRQFFLRVGQPDYFTEMFGDTANDLAFSTITFTPDGSASFYAACRQVATNFPTDPAGGNFVSLDDDDYVQVTLSGTNSVAIYNQRRNVFFIGSNGYLTTDYGDDEYVESLDRHFDRPRVSALFDDLYPGDGGSVSWKELSNRVAVTFQNVPEYGTSDQNSFQIEMFFNGRIRLTWLALAARDGLAGLSAGTGVPVGFLESDLSSYGSCVPPLLVNIPASATEGDGVLAGAGHVIFPALLTTNVTVVLTSSDTNQVTVPASVLALAGQSNVSFYLTIVDDALLDGTQTASISATASGFGDGSAKIAVHDNETATLSLNVPATVMENGGSTNGVVWVNAAPAANVVVNLSSSDTTELQVPPTVLISAGQTSAVFTITIVNDTLIDGSQPVTLTAHVQNWADGNASITVLDDEALTLTVTLPASAYESSGVLTNAGRVNLAGTLPTNLIVNLVSSDTTELLVPATVSILAGQTFANFNLTMVDDLLVNGTRTAFVTASAAPFANGSASLMILDDESPPVPSNPSPPHLATDISANADLAWSSLGPPSDPLTPITNDVYFGTNPTPGPAEFQGSTSNTAWSLPLLAPLTTYYWQIISHRIGTTPGPVWQFTTRGVDHFDFDTVASPQLVNQPFAVTIRARDEFSRVVSNFTGKVTLTGTLANGYLGLPGGSNLVVETDSSIANSVRFVLDNLGRPYDFVQTSTLSDLNLTNYNTVILGMDGGEVEYPDMAHLAAAVNAGAKLIVLGGSRYLPFASGLNDFFIRINTNNYDWTTVAGSPDFSVTTPGHPLATGLPPAYNFIDNDASYYMARVTDGSATTVAFNGDGFACLTTKPVGAGAVVMFINSPADDYWSNPGDFNLLRTVISNSLQWVSGGLPIPITPTNSGNFANGVWTGNITVLQPATNMFLMATDDGGHRGTSSNFDALIANDLGVAIVSSPNPIGVGAYLTNIISVYNSGPTTATAITLTNFLPPSVSYVSTIPSQGSCALISGRVECSLGSLTGGATAIVTVVTIPTVVGSITNLVAIGRGEPDGYFGNNVAQSVTSVFIPSLSIADTGVLEGNSGLTPAVFSVRLFPASPTNVTVNFATADGTAQAGSDYLSTNGILVFAPGQTNLTITVQVIGDTTGEPNETFSVVLSSPINANLGNALGIGTIFTDDLPPDVYLRSTAGAPWGSTANETAMNRVFGTNSWQDLRYETVNPAGLFTPATRFIFMEGSDADALELQAFLTANISTIQNWVSAGGRLFLNAAPNEGTGMSFGFGVTLLYPEYTPIGTAADPLHLIFQGPFTPIGVSWSGNSFGHGTVSGTGLTALITNNATGHIVLGQKLYGSGLVLFGGMTTDNYHSPQPQGSNLRANILDYTAKFVLCTNCPPSILTQPHNQIVRAGLNVSFSATASGTLPLTFYWQRGGTNLTNGGRISGADTSTLTISNCVEGDSGLYSVIVSNAFGTALSSNATLLVSRLDHFAWSVVPSPQIKDVPFAVMIEARDSSNHVVTNFNGTVALSGSIGTPGPTNILLFEYANSHYFRVALGQLGLVFQGYSNANEAAFSAAVSAANTNTTLVIVDAGSTFSTFNPIIAFVGAGGRAILEYWQLSVQPSLAAAFNGVVITEFTTPLPVYNWGGSPLFAGVPNPINFVETTWGVDGDKLNPTAGGVAVGGFVSSSNSGQAAVIVGNSGRTILNGFLLDDAQVAGDAVLLAKNEILSLLTSTASVAITPAVTGNFTNGLWTGNITSLDTATNVILLADDLVGHTGRSNPFNVVSSNQPPIFLVQPIAQSARPGTNVIFSVNVLGTPPLTYKWQRNGIDLIADGRINGVASPVLTISNTIENDSGLYSVLVSNEFGTNLSATAALTVSLLDHFTWSPISSPQTTNVPFAVTIQARDSFNQIVSNYSGTVALRASIGGGAASILPSPAYESYYGGNQTVGYSFTPNTDITVTAVRHYFGTKVSIWTDAGVLLRAQPVASVPGTWAETPLATPLVLTAGTRYRVASYSGDDYIYQRNSGVGTFPNGTIDANLFVGGDGFPVNPSSTLWLVDLRYTVGTSAPVSITPSTAGIFTNGSWSGNVSVLNAATNAVLLADDGAAHIGLSNPFHVVRSNQPPIIVTPPFSQAVHAFANATFSVDVFGSLPLTYQWRRNNTNLTNGGRIGGANTSVLTISNCLDTDSGIYSVNITSPYGSASTSTNAVLTVKALDHFAWQLIPSPVSTLSPFAVTVEARDFSNQVVTSFNGTVALSAAVSGTGTPVPLSPTTSDFFSSGIWHGFVSISTIVSNVVLLADDGHGEVGLSTPFNVAQVPGFSLQPTNQSVLPGTNVSLVAAAIGTGPLHYQWRFEGTNILNATNATYSFTNASLSNHGNYSVAVTDNIGTSVSANAFIYVLIRPGFLVQPASQTTVQGGSAVFTAIATGAPPIWYRWIRSGTSVLTNNTGIFVLTNLQTVGTFNIRATATNLASPAINSATVNLIVQPDFDHDGVGDWWEAQYGFSTNVANGTLDSDGDGMSNLDEFIAGTNPTNALSVLKLTLTPGNVNALQFIAQSNISYTVQYRSNLLGAAWQTVTNIPGQTNSVRTIVVNTTNSPPANFERYYRVVTPLLSP